jgi:tetratricopeptide (TPR) repeat protein
MRRVSFASIVALGSLLAFLAVANGALVAGAQTGAPEPSAVADKYFAGGNYEAAAAEYRKLIASGTDVGRSWFELGASLQRLKRYDDAVPAYQQALRLKFDPKNTYYQLARIAALKGDTAAAVDDLSKMTAAGFVAEQQLTKQPDFAPIASDGRFIAIVDGIRRKMHPCAYEPQYRGMDFWLGDWDVRNAAGGLAGTSHVELILDKCIVYENWTGTYGDEGKSFNHYDTNLQKWVEYYVGNRAGTMWTGAVSNGAVVFESGSGSSRQRLTFTPLPDGRVHQLFESSADGANWTPSTDLYYSRRKP